MGAPITGRLPQPCLQGDQTWSSFFARGVWVAVKIRTYRPCDPAQCGIQGCYGVVACIRREVEWCLNVEKHGFSVAIGRNLVRHVWFLGLWSVLGTPVVSSTVEWIARLHRRVNCSQGVTTNYHSSSNLGAVLERCNSTLSL